MQNINSCHLLRSLKLDFMLFSATKVKKTDENYWMVGFNASNVFCIVCKSPNTFPQVVQRGLHFLILLIWLQNCPSKWFTHFQVTPKPVLTLLNFAAPLASSDIGAEALENEFMLNYIHLSQVWGIQSWTCLVNFRKLAFTLVRITLKYAKRPWIF